MLSDYKVGEYIIDFLIIYQITLVDTNVGKDDVVIHYKPIVGTDKVFTASIPMRNMEKGGFRKILTLKETKQVLDSLKTSLIDYQYNNQETKEVIYRNKPGKTVFPLKYLWKINDGLLKSDMDMKEAMIKHLCMEIAFITKEPSKTIRLEIEKNLNM